MLLISLTTHTVCRGMTTYDFIVHEQKKLRDKSPAGAIPAAEINTEVVEVEDETTRVVGEGGGEGGSDEEEGELSAEAEAALKAEQIEMTAQMSQKILEQQQQRAMQGDIEGGTYIPDPDPIVDLYNRQQRQLPQGRVMPTNLLNDFIPSRLPRPLDSPDKGGVSSSASSVSSSGSNIEFYADQFAASHSYSLVDSAAPFPPLTKARLVQVQGTRLTLNLSRGEGQGQGQGLSSPGGVGSSNAGPKSVLQLEQDSPKNKVSIWTRRPSQNTYTGGGGGGADGLDFSGADGTSSGYREEVKYFTQPMTPPPRPIYHGSRVPANKAVSGLSSPPPINPFAEATEKSKGLWEGEEEKDISNNTQTVKENL